MRYVLTLALALMTLAGGGCNLLAFPLYVFARRPTKSVAPEYDGLGGKHVAVVVYAGPDIQLDFQTVQLEVADAVGAEMARQLKDLTLIDPRRVMRYQDENPRWDAEPPENMCKTFGCDFVLLISLVEFATREPGSTYLVRGRLTAEASLYRSCTGAEGGRVWRSAEQFRVVHPSDRPLGVPAGGEGRIRAETEKVFAEALAKKFYKHKVPIEP